MRVFRLTSVLIAFAAAAVVAGCGPEYDGYPDRPGYPYPGPREGYDNSSGDVQGTVVRVGRRDHVIVLDRSDADGRYDPRYGGDPRRGRGEIALFYDDDTTVEFQGRTYRPEDLERGDRIQVSVGRTQDGRPFAEEIRVLYDVSSGSRDDSGYRGEPGYPEDRPEPPGYRGDRGDRGDRSLTDLRGTVRRIDPRDHSLEIEPSGDDSNAASPGQSDVVVVHYNAQTAVEYQGRNYSPENLEEGDVVEVRLRRDRGGRLLADEITVVSSVSQRG